MALFHKDLPDAEIASLVRKAIALQHEERYAKALETVAPLRRAAKKQRVAAQGLAMLLRGGALGIEGGLEVAAQLLSSWGDEVWAVAAIGEAAEVLHDVHYLNSAPPDAPIFVDVKDRLEALVEQNEGSDAEIHALEGLTTVARVLGRDFDDVADRAHRRIIERDPERWESHFNYGLFLKTRGRFADGMAVNQRALELGGSENDGVAWNLGICATGAGDAATALATWKSLHQTIEMGRYGLPEGGYHPVKVRVVERPLASRAPGEPQDPGAAEAVWVERLSPCHGVVRSATYQDLGIDYGDLVLFDGAAITYERDDEGDDVPVFPQLVTLARNEYQIYRFAGTEARAGAIAELSESLPHDAVTYVHADPEREGVVSGKLCAPPGLEAAELAAALEAAIAGAGVKLFVPELHRAAGAADRAEVEVRRMSMLLDSPP